jgi:hypothetical protein
MLETDALVPLDQHATVFSIVPEPSVDIPGNANSLPASACFSPLRNI